MPLTHARELSSGQGRKTGVGTSEEEGGGSKGRLVSHGTEDLQSRVYGDLHRAGGSGIC